MTAAISLESQVSELARLRALCAEARDKLHAIRQQMEDLGDGETQQQEAISLRHETELRNQLERIARETGDRLMQLEQQITGIRAAANSAHDCRLNDCAADYKSDLASIQQKLQSELWVLQSVCDEENEDTPVREAERERDIFETQRANIDHRMVELAARVEATEVYLQHCHAATDSAIPPVNVPVKGREASHTLATTQADMAVLSANVIDRQSLPQWMCGLRLHGLAFTIFIVVTIVATGARADLRSFLNPELRSPDWQWLGVSALIGGGITALVTTVMLVLVQSRLRGHFAEMLQHTANAKAAIEYWTQKSEQELKKIEAAADAWKKAMLKHRDRNSAKLQNSAAEQARERTRVYNEQLARQQKLLHEQIAASEAELAREQSAIERWRQQETAQIQAALNSQRDRATADLIDRNSTARAMLHADEANTIARWQSFISTAKELARISREKVAAIPRWATMRGSNWTVPTALPAALSAGDLLVTLPALPHDSQSESASSLCLELPAILNFPGDTSIAVEHDVMGREPALEFVRAILLRLLTSIMPGRVQFTLIDPVGLGQSFSALMHLTDFDELMISNRIWTDATQIRDRLQAVTEHMESVFQTYLRSEFETIEDYNAAAGEVAEPYHFVVVAGFPAAFTEEAARHLTSILTSGPRCGVHAIVAWSANQPVPRSFDLNDLKERCIEFTVKDRMVVPECGSSAEVIFEPITSPESADYVNLVRAVGEQSRNARRVEVSFSRIAPKSDAIWGLSSADGIDFPIGRAGAARLQYMRLGRGTSQHVLVAGKTGSGKSTLLHILITNMALYYSPDEIQFYLIDFKKGVEFRTYAANKLPHARVVAIESDREFGLSVLERLDEVLQERGELFRIRGVQDVPSFRRQFPKERMPRLLLLIDEFQEFFTVEDRVSSRASLLLDRLVRQGRAFGIHVLLGSQTLGGAYSLARSTMGQVGVRIALQCSESDAHLILSEENSAARLLTRPGEAIYNDANGMVEGNHPFQIAWLEETQRESMIQDLIARPDYIRDPDSRMIVFEGNMPPRMELCNPLNARLTSPIDATRHFVDTLPVWIGEPVAIAAPMCIELRRSGGQNLLIVGQEGDLADAILASTIVSWSVGNFTAPEHTASELTLLHDGRDRASQTRFEETFTKLIAPGFRLVELPDAEVVIEELWQQMTARENGETPPNSRELILAVRNIGQFRALRRDEDDYGMSGFGSSKAATPASMLGDLIRKGPVVGIHVLIWADTFSNAMRWLSTSLLREFDNRIAFRLNQTDSASLIDTPAAAGLSQGRAILYRDQTGTADRFRPFNWPTDEWLQSIAAGAVSPEEHPDFDINTLKIE
jgi:S-DNA-T family DNA segregation ATPase FtsK/SpoIIIE